MARFDYMKTPEPTPHDYKCAICTKETHHDSMICDSCADRIERVQCELPRDDWSIHICLSCLETGYAETDFYAVRTHKFRCPLCHSTKTKFFTCKELADKGII